MAEHVTESPVASKHRFSKAAGAPETKASPLPLSSTEEAHPSIAGDATNELFWTDAAIVETENALLWRLDELAAIGSPLQAIPIPSEMMEMAEEIVDCSDVYGLETGSLELLIRLVIFLDRQQRA